MNDAKTKIVAVEVREDRSEKLGQPSRWGRGEVIAAIEGGKTFVTGIKTDEGKFRKGAEVHVVEVSGEKFIRTDRNSVKADNLGELPDF